MKYLLLAFKQDIVNPETPHAFNEYIINLYQCLRSYTTLYVEIELKASLNLHFQNYIYFDSSFISLN